MSNFVIQVIKLHALALGKVAPGLHFHPPLAELSLNFDAAYYPL
jgi:hypothetical protein